MSDQHIEAAGRNLHERWASEGTAWPCLDCQRGATIAVRTWLDSVGLVGNLADWWSETLERHGYVEEAILVHNIAEAIRAVQP